MPPADGVFVLQLHDATTLHFDLRLQTGPDRFASWAVPKGPSLDPREKRLAVRTDDHTREQATFEGVFPGPGPRGRARPASTIVWDTGPLTSLTADEGVPVPLVEAVERGHVRVRVEGKRLRGEFALTRTAMGGDPRNWLVVKVDDAEARTGTDHDPVMGRPESGLTGRTHADLAGAAADSAT